MSEQIFLALVLAGVAAMVAGVFVTRLYWRDDVAPYRSTSALRVLLHPEEFTRAPHVRALRWLNRGGLVLVAAAAVVALFEIARTMAR